MPDRADSIDLPAAYRGAPELDGGEMDCGSGLLLLITRALRQVEIGSPFVLRTREASVLADLPAWAQLAGHRIDAVAGGGPWQIGIVRGDPPPPAVRRAPGDGFSTGAATPLGSRMWIYTNFDCNLACDYCCAASSPGAARRRFPVELAAEAVDQLAAAGGRELLLTGGEPFLHPELVAITELAPPEITVTILTNAMIFRGGRRRAMLEALDPSRVRLQVSLDSADAALHDSHRGSGSHALAVRGIQQATAAGFTVRVAATIADASPRVTAPLHDLLSEWGIAPADRLIRPVAEQGVADHGLRTTLDELEPEPTLTVDGAWWHPVAVTDQTMRVADRPLPWSDVLGTISELVAITDRARAAGHRHVFRCA